MPRNAHAMHSTRRTLGFRRQARYEYEMDTNYNDDKYYDNFTTRLRTYILILTQQRLFCNSFYEKSA